MATRSYSYIVAGNENTHGAPGTRLEYDDLPKTVFAYDDDYSSKLKTGNPDQEKAYVTDHLPEMKHLVENAMGGALGFLASAGESIGDHRCGDVLLRTAVGEQCDVLFRELHRRGRLALRGQPQRLHADLRQQRGRRRRAMRRRQWGVRRRLHLQLHRRAILGMRHRQRTQ